LGQGFGRDVEGTGQRAVAAAHLGVEVAAGALAVEHDKLGPPHFPDRKRPGHIIPAIALLAAPIGGFEAIRSDRQAVSEARENLQQGGTEGEAEEDH
jgi:hypothetical protein